MPETPPEPPTYRLTLTIRGQPYTVRPIPAPAHGNAARAFRLRKPDGTQYHVTETQHGPQCDCADFIYRRDQLDPFGCKHVRACVALGLIANPNLDPPLEPLPRKERS